MALAHTVKQKRPNVILEFTDVSGQKHEFEIDNNEAVELFEVLFEVLEDEDVE